MTRAKSGCLVTGPLVGLVVIGLLFAVAEVIVRLYAPQPIDYFTYKKKPSPGTVYQRWGGVEVRINSHGFRDKEYAVEKEERCRTIAVIGDSITHGYGVRIEETYHKRLESILNSSGEGDTRYEVPAFNVGASDTINAIHVYQDVVKYFHPNIVMLGFCLNDFLNYDQGPKNANPSIKRKAYGYLATVNSRLRAISHLYFLLVERSRRLLYRYNVFDITLRRYDAWLPILDPGSAEFERRFSSTFSLLKKFTDEVNRDEAEFIVVIFPSEAQLDEEHVDLYRREYGITELKGSPGESAQARLRRELDREGVLFIDLLTAYRRAVEEDRKEILYFRQLGQMLDAIHPNPAGHDLAARTIAEFLEKRRVPGS